MDDAAVFDPADEVQVYDAVVTLLRSEHPDGALTAPPHRVTAATSTWVWFLELGGTVPEDWLGEQVLRIFPPAEAATAETEQVLCDHLTAHGYPVARTRWRGTLGRSHPALLQQRLAGRPAADLLASPRLPSMVRSLGDLQARLHAIDPGDLPVPRLSAADYLDSDLAPRRAAVRADDPHGTWEWLLCTATTVDREDSAVPVLCHGDFHPLNAVVAPDRSIGIVDWTDVCVADRHHDVGRTIAIYWFASIVAASTAERIALRALRGWLGRTHRRAYEARSGTALDDRRLAWWQVVHLYRGWLQLGELAEGAVEDRGSSTTERFPAELRDRLLDRCTELRRSFDR